MAPESPPATIVEVISRYAGRAPTSVALFFDGVETSYAGLAGGSARLADALRAEGIKPGDRVGYLGKNSDRYFALLYAVASLRAVLVPMNWRLAEDEWAYIAEDSGLVRLYADADFAEAAARLAERRGIAPALSIPPLDERGSAGDLALIAQADDVVFQVYTSGTTGRPKGAMLTHRNMLSLRDPGYRAGIAWFPRERDVSMVVLPVAHIAGTAYALFGLYAGGRIVISREFDAGETMALIESQRGTHMLLAPAALRIMLDHPDFAKRDLSSLKYLTYGASPIPSALLTRALAELECGFVQMYGMTEAAGGVVVLSPEDHASGDPRLLRSAGYAMPGVEVAILDASGQAVAAGYGEILVRSEAVMPGYWRRPEATVETIDADGWLHTGDIGEIDETGLVFVLDRAKDMIISGGENIYPAEVEDVLFAHPDIVEAGVFGLPSERWGEEPAAAIVMRDGVEADFAAITAWASSRLGRFKVPRHYFVVAALPRNAGNKILRRELRAAFGQNAQSAGGA